MKTNKTVKAELQHITAAVRIDGMMVVEKSELSMGRLYSNRARDFVCYLPICDLLLPFQPLQMLDIPVSSTLARSNQVIAPLSTGGRDVGREVT